MTNATSAFQRLVDTPTYRTLMETRRSASQVAGMDLIAMERLRAERYELAREGGVLEALMEVTRQHGTKVSARREDNSGNLYTRGTYAERTGWFLETASGTTATVMEERGMKRSFQEGVIGGQGMLYPYRAEPQLSIRVKGQLVLSTAEKFIIPGDHLSELLESKQTPTNIWRGLPEEEKPAPREPLPLRPSGKEGVRIISKEDLRTFLAETSNAAPTAAQKLLFDHDPAPAPEAATAPNRRESITRRLVMA